MSIKPAEEFDTLAAVKAVSSSWIIIVGKNIKRNNCLMNITIKLGKIHSDYIYIHLSIADRFGCSFVGTHSLHTIDPIKDWSQQQFVQFFVLIRANKFIAINDQIGNTVQQPTATDQIPNHGAAAIQGSISEDSKIQIHNSP